MIRILESLVFFKFIYMLSIQKPQQVIFFPLLDLLLLCFFLLRSPCQVSISAPPPIPPSQANKRKNTHILVLYPSSSVLSDALSANTNKLHEEQVSFHWDKSTVNQDPKEGGCVPDRDVVAVVLGGGGVRCFLSE